MFLAFINLCTLAGAILWLLHSLDHSSCCCWLLDLTPTILAFSYTLHNLHLQFYSRCWKHPACWCLNHSLPKCHSVFELLDYTHFTSTLLSLLGQGGFVLIGLFQSSYLFTLFSIWFFLAYQFVLFLFLPCTLEDRHFFFFFKPQIQTTFKTSVAKIYWCTWELRLKSTPVF